MSVKRIVIGCGDGRLADPRTLLRRDCQMGLITVPGACLCLRHDIPTGAPGHPVINAEMLWPQLALYLNAHTAIEHIVVVAHEDCAAAKLIALGINGVPRDMAMSIYKTEYRPIVSMLYNRFGKPVEVYYQTLGNHLHKLDLAPTG